MPSSTRRPVPLHWTRVLFVLAGLAAVAAVVGLVVTSGDDGPTGTEAVTTFAPTDSSNPSQTSDTSDTNGATTTAPSNDPPSTPTTQAPPSDDSTDGESADDQADDAPPPDEPPPTTMPTPTTTPLSPLAAQLGDRGSAIPEALEPRIVPTALAIDDLYIDVPVRPVGLEDDGQLEIPDETEVGWYRYGAVPGRPGATVLAGHVTWNRTNGPFWLLRDLEPGAFIDVEMADGSVRTYEAVERAVYGKDELPRNRIWRNTGDETLVLITCGGAYNPDIRRYLENVVVYAVPVDGGSGASDGQGNGA